MRARMRRVAEAVSAPTLARMNRIVPSRRRARVDIETQALRNGAAQSKNPIRGAGMCCMPALRETGCLLLA